MGPSRGAHLPTVEWQSLTTPSNNISQKVEEFITPNSTFYSPYGVDEVALGKVEEALSLSAIAELTTA
jgi:hypothetical protein